MENLDDSPESIILESVIEGMAQHYSANLAREVKKGMTETALKCRHNGGIPPTGFKVNPTTKLLEIEDSEAIIVSRIFELYNAGFGYAAICDDLNKAGYKTKLGVPFGKNSIVCAISDGLYQQSMKERLNTLETEKAKIEAELKQLSEVQPEIPLITEGMIKTTLANFKQFIQTRNIPEVARFIRSYVERVEAGKDDVKVTFKATFSFTHGLQPMTFTETHPVKPQLTEYKPPKAM